MPNFCCFKISNTALTAQTNLLDLITTLPIAYFAYTLHKKTLLQPINQKENENLKLISQILFINSLIIIGSTVSSILFFPVKCYQKFYRVFRFFIAIPSLIISTVFTILYGCFIFNRIDFLQNSTIPILGELKRKFFEDQIQDLKIYFGVVIGVGVLSYFRFCVVGSTFNAKYKD